MATFIITVKLPKTPGHDGRNKQTGPCPVNGLPCTDVTGEHHTFLADLEGHSLDGREMDAEGVRDLYSDQFHVTRVESV